MLKLRDHELSNGTIYGIQSSAVRNAWAGYFLFVVASSFIGDTVILVASIKYKAFKLHRIIIVIIQHIALCDLMLSVTVILPRLVSLFAGEWVFGDILCYLNCHSTCYFNSASALLISAMTTSKLILLLYPLRIGTTTSKRAHLLCTACWLAASPINISNLFINRRDVLFSYRRYTCDFAFSSDIWLWLQPLIALFILFVPPCVVIITTVWLLTIAWKVVGRGQGSLKWQGIMATAITAICYCISILPTAVYRLGMPIMKVEDKSKSIFHNQFYRVAVTILTLNTISNFYIYSLTVSSFREFVLSRMQICYQFFTEIGTSTSYGENIAIKIQFNINKDFRITITQLCMYQLGLYQNSTHQE